MGNRQIVVGLDIGTTKIAVVVGEISEGSINIIGEGTSQSFGIRKGVVVDLEDTVRSIERACELAERMAGVSIESAYVGIAGEHISSLNNRGVVAVTGPKGEITEEDVERVKEAAKIIPLPSDREIIHLIPRDYIIDGQKGIKSPVGMSGLRLELETHIVTGATSFIQNLLKCVKMVGITVEGLVLQSLASSEAVLSPEEKELGVILADIGGGTTDLAIYTNGSIAHTTILPVGGSNIDRDIAYGLSTTISESERLKKEYGYASVSLTNSDELIKVKNVGDEKEREIPVSVLCEIIEARVQEIFELIKKELVKAGCQDMVPAGIVIAGGTAQLRGISELARESLDLPARVGIPEKLSGLAEQVQSPFFATGVGLVLHGSKNILEGKSTRRAPMSFWWEDMFSRIKKWFKEFV